MNTSGRRSTSAADALSVLVQATAEALVRKVDKRNRATALEQRGDLLPLVQVDRSAPVGLWQLPCSSTTSPCLTRSRPAHHRVEVDAVVRGVEVGVGFDRQPGVAEERAGGWARSAG